LHRQSLLGRGNQHCYGINYTQARITEGRTDGADLRQRDHTQNDLLP
jgi:hypothetical protein